MSADEIKMPIEQIEKIVDERVEKKLAGGKYVTHADLDKIKGETPGREAREHAHKPEEFMPAYVKSYKCPDGNCGRIHENPRYKKAEAYCTDCGNPYDNVDDAKKAEKCPGCGGTAPAKRFE